MFSCLIPIVGFCVREIVFVVLFLEPCLAGVIQVSREMPCISRFERGVEKFFGSQIQEQISEGTVECSGCPALPLFDSVKKFPEAASYAKGGAALREAG